MMYFAFCRHCMIGMSVNKPGVGRTIQPKGCEAFSDCRVFWMDEFGRDLTPSYAVDLLSVEREMIASHRPHY